jgi:transcriptional regulator with XRE-family HTH domain
MAQTPKEPRPPAIGPVGKTVVANIAELAAARGLSLRQLSERLGAIGRPILPSVLHALSQGNRRVDADDLIAISMALGVSPPALLLPRHVAADEVIELTPEVRQRASIAWDWVAGKWPLPDESPWPEGQALFFPQTVVIDFSEHSRPDFRPPEPRPLPSQDTLEALTWQIGEVRKDPAKWPEFRDKVLRNFRILAIQLEEVFASFDAAAVADGTFTFDAEAAKAEILTATGWVRGPAVNHVSGSLAMQRMGMQGEAAPRSRIVGPGAVEVDPDRTRGAATTVPGPHGAPTSAAPVPGADPPSQHGAATSKTVDPLDPFGEREP